MGKDSNYVPLFETKGAKGRKLYWVYAISVLIGILFICFHRVNNVPTIKGRWGWIGLLMAEVWYICYWIITQSLRCNAVYRHTFKDRLSHRFRDEELPSIDIFVCTANHVKEPPSMVINTVLSLMAYNYPPQKMNVYLSDDGCSEFMFFALFEASEFSKKWLPFCKKFKVQTPSPAAYFSMNNHELSSTDEFISIKKLYEAMIKRIDETTRQGHVPEMLRKQHKGFREWNFISSKQDHHTIIQILIDKRDSSENVDVVGQILPTLVYLAREKRPQHHHHFKAGAMNALIRVSARISNSPIILNVDCDMYSNNSESVRDALCFFLDEEQSDGIAFVQYPQQFSNITKNDLYSNSLRLITEVELPGLDASGGPLYIGTGCFHGREVLSGKKYSKGSKIINYNKKGVYNKREYRETSDMLEETCKILASCSYEEDTQWGKEVGLKYGCAVEDVITGLAIQCRGWKSVYFNPERKGFLGLAPTTLLETLVQHKRWAEGNFQIFLSKYCPFIYGKGKIPLKLQISYCSFLLCAPNWMPTLYYTIVPSSCLLHGISLFPKLSSLWMLPYAHVAIATTTNSLVEHLWCGGTLKGWWNDQRLWLYKRLTSYLFAFFQTIFTLVGFTKSGFVVTAKGSDNKNVTQRYEQEIIEFATTSSSSTPMFYVLATIALSNLFCFGDVMLRVIMDRHEAAVIVESLGIQILLTGLIVVVNLPLYEGLFLRNDRGCMPFAVTCSCLVLATFLYLLAKY
ncbi:PREDICTED: cellulose synthase-like protein E6 [Nicotiana attenuata]|uniref:Cellulose synthase-like protein e6 n=1 Tax=Nicotiana attenuata TaxID=49451 RepID=A0A314KHY3_NICAT|nr:PREDICTED: cellulose synthase-like protein E6 [Nicotiana attenuata]OIT28966.1 cellulose synthase-like protein e6 [Nicotiana attenuata]